MFSPPLPQKNFNEFVNRDKIPGRSANPPPVPPKCRSKLPGSPNPPQKKHSDDRGCIVSEILNNELKFKKDMALVTEVLTSGCVHTRISPTDFGSIFLNLPQYIHVSSEIIAAYNKAIEESPGKNPAEACIGKHFLALLPKLQNVVVEFLKLFDPQLVTNRPHLKQYVDEVTTALHLRDGSTIVLLDRLLQGFQKPFHISNLFSRLQNSTPINHPDYEATRGCYAEIQKFIAIAESAKKKECHYSTTGTLSPINRVPENVNADWFSTIDGKLTEYSKKIEKIKSFAEFFNAWMVKKASMLYEFVQKRRKLITCEMALISDFKRVTKFNLKSRYLDFSEFNNSSPISTDKLEKDCEEISRNLSTLVKKMQKPTGKIKMFREYFKDVQKKLKKGDLSQQSSRDLLSTYQNKESNFIADMGNFIRWSDQIIECCVIFFNHLMTGLLQHVSIMHIINVHDSPLKLRLNEQQVKQQLETNLHACLNNITEFCQLRYAPTLPFRT